MKEIWKYILSIKDKQTIEMPTGAEILSVQMQGSDLCLWAMVNPLAIKEGRLIDIFGTGHPVSHGYGVKERKFIGTVQKGIMVWHVFECIVDD